MSEKTKNQQAWELLDEALFTSSHVKKKDIEKGSTDWDNVYPTSPEEVNRMEELVERAVNEADDPDEENFKERVYDLRDIISWSKEKHSTWKWQLIAGTLLALGIFYYWNSGDKETLTERKALVEQVEAWTECDTTLTYEQAQVVNYESRYHSAVWYKMYNMGEAKENITRTQNYIKEEKQRLDTCSNDKTKKHIQENIAKNEEYIKTYQEQFHKFSAMKYQDVKDMALDEVKKSAGRAANSNRKTKMWMIYSIIIIPLYVFAGRAMGYEITNARRRHKILGFIQKWGFRLALLFFGTGVAMSLFPDQIVKYSYSDGHSETRREADIMNIMVLLMKFGLMLVGVFIFSFLSLFLISVETFFGLKDMIVKRRQVANPLLYQ